MVFPALRNDQNFNIPNRLQELKTLKNELKVQEVAFKVLRAVCLVSAITLFACTLTSIISPIVGLITIPLCIATKIFDINADGVERRILAIENEIRRIETPPRNAQVQVLDPINLRREFKESLPDHISELSPRHLENMRAERYEDVIDQHIQDSLEEVFARYITLDQKIQTTSNAIKEFPNRLSKRQNEIDEQIRILQAQTEGDVPNQINKLQMEKNSLENDVAALRQERLYQKKLSETIEPFQEAIRELNQEYLNAKNSL